jgi:hypothetical protein
MFVNLVRPLMVVVLSGAIVSIGDVPVKAGCINFAGVSICDNQPSNQPTFRQTPTFTQPSSPSMWWCCQSPPHGVQAVMCDVSRAKALAAVGANAATSNIPGPFTCVTKPMGQS